MAHRYLEGLAVKGSCPSSRGRKHLLVSLAAINVPDIADEQEPVLTVTIAFREAIAADLKTTPR